MSLILDALKKSEAERQRGQVPNLLSPSPTIPSQYGAHKKTNLPWFILTAFLVSALIPGYFFMKSDGVRTPETSIATTATLPTNPPTAETNTPEPATSVSAPATPASQATAIATPPSPAASVPSKSPPSLFETKITSAPENPTPDVVASPQEARIAGMAEMPVDQRQQLPALKLSMHVYSSESAKRFAIIDGQRINEGSVIGAAVVEEIRQDGVVLSVQGQSYLLPRP